MSKQLCLGCMKEYGNKYQVCPHCGYIKGTGPKEAYHLSPGTLLQGRYIIGRVLGYGGFGVTYIGYDKVLTKPVAIKEYFPGNLATRACGTTEITIFSGEREEQFINGLEKFIEEARKLAKFKYQDGIVDIHDSFKENKTAYIVMEYLDGESLATKLEREGKLPVDEAMGITCCLLGALQIVHQEGILHRDVQPSNIFITSTGQVKLLDFGASRYATTTHSKSLSVLLTSGFAPIEQYRSRGDQGTWTDVYGCAATLYKMLTGVTPEDSMERGSKDTLLPPSKLGVRLPKNKENAIMNALNIKIEDRTQRAEDFERDLKTDSEVKRKRVKNKKMDIGRWPIWLKIATGAVAAAVVSFAILLLTEIISFGTLNIFDRGSLDEDSVYVPNVVNYNLDEAQKKIEDVQLITQIVGKTNSDYIPKNMVLTQGIQDGEIVKVGTVLEITISAGGQLVYIPDLQGMTREDAAKTLDELGVYYDIKEEKSDIAIGCVTEQNFEEGAALEKGSSIVITLSTGTDNIDENVDTTVPDMVGKTWAEAVDMSGKSKLYIYKTSVEYSERYPKGQVISQNVTAGDKVKQGTEVGVVVSLGIKMTRVPDVQYKTLAEAESILNEANLVVDIQYENSDTVARDHVIRQSVEYGTEVEMQTVVTIWVSRGNSQVESTPVPGGNQDDSGGNVASQTTETREENTQAQTTQVTTEQATTEQATTEQATTEQATTENVNQHSPVSTNATVPNLIGKKEGEATSLLSESGLKVGSITYKHDESKANGVVLSQGVASGTTVSKNTQINIVVCNNQQYTEYRYRTKTTKSVTNQTLSEGILVDSQESWSSWSGESTTPITGDEYTEVSTRTEVSYLDNPGAPLPVPTSNISTTNRSYRADVAWVQTFLNAYYGPLLSVDGIYGGLTLYYVGVFQREFGLVDDKSVGSTTAQTMLQAWRDRTATTTTYYKYRTKTVVNTYEMWSSWSGWSTTYVEESDDKEVETRMMYKY